MHMTEEERRARLIKWLEEIYREVQQQRINEFIFWELQKIVNENENFRGASGLFTRWMADGFKNSAVIAARRQIKFDKQAISLRGLLEEVKKFPELISRTHYISLFNGKPKQLVAMGQRDFDLVADAGVDCIRLDLVDQQIAELSGSAAKVEEYADRRVAHYDKREPARPLPTFDDLSAAIKVQEKLVIFYWWLLKGANVSTLLPAIVFDWHDVFKFPWKPE
jgi:hypothetical protein